MASLSAEEENYVRMSLLLTGISPRAVRVLFDSEFHPSCLDSSLKKAYNKLLDLKKKRVINEAQWNLLFTRFPDRPDSKTFDVTLMITLLRNLTKISPTGCGFDHLPTTMETTAGSDLSRIKYYRNYMAHLGDGKLDTTFFNTAWNNITGAINRLGGQQMNQECEHLKTKPLDQTNQEIMLEIKCSNDEIRELKNSFESLKLSHTKMKKSHELLQENHTNVTKELQKIKSSQTDTVPWNVRAQFNKILDDWKINDQMFINTRAAEHVLKCIKENSCVTITASSGAGKTATLRNVVLKMANEKFDILLVSEPGNIVQYYNPNKKTLFVIDDLCGNFSVAQSDIKSWDPLIDRIKDILKNKQTKIIAACRLQVFQDEKFDTLSVFKSCVCNMLLEEIRLSKNEKTLIAELYMKSKASDIDDYYDLYDCFPLLCKMFHDNPNFDAANLFQKPFSVYESEIDKLFKKGHFTKYCALALCVMFNNELKAELLTEDVSAETKIIFEKTMEACKIDRGTSLFLIQNELDSLTHTYIEKEMYFWDEKYFYTTLHDKIFDFLAYYFGQKIPSCLIKYADSCLIHNRFMLEKEDSFDSYISIIPSKYHQIYIDRITEEWSKGNVRDIFCNINMKIPQFRQTLLLHLNTLDTANQKRLAQTYDKESNTTDDDYDWFDEEIRYDSVLSHCCMLGDIPLINWCLNNAVDVNQCTLDNQSTVMIATLQGHTETVKILMDNGADCNKCDRSGESPIMKACMLGHTEIVKILLERGADYKKSDSYGTTPLLMACKHGFSDIVLMFAHKRIYFDKSDNEGLTSLLHACEHGHKDIVEMLLDEGVYYNQSDNKGWTPLIFCCRYGYLEIVKLLLERGADYEKCDSWNQSPVMKACEHGHVETVQLLLDRGVKCNESNNLGLTPLLKACKYGHTEIVKTLLDKGIDCNKGDKLGQSPLIYACTNGHTDIVGILLNKGVDCDKFDIHGRTPIMHACENGYTEIVKLLSDKGVDVNYCDNNGQSPLKYSCENDNTDIVRILLDKGVEYNKSDKNDRSPLWFACRMGNLEIVQLLSDKGADCDKCDYRHNTPVMKACKYGHTDIVKMLLEKGIDYDRVNILRQSPLIKACKHGHADIVEMLLDKGVDYNKSDINGWTSIAYAGSNGDTEIVKMLLEKEVIS
ncbi:uncharacterized protein LOC134710409 [Mytilus trossulus]|uniref:uncharacterized protein LOC134710409 n=1 Tax=Mytilus trossulus TaxID=6551 RepID=UPI003005F9C3